MPAVVESSAPESPRLAPYWAKVAAPVFGSLGQKAELDLVTKYFATCRSPQCKRYIGFRIVFGIDLELFLELSFELILELFLESLLEQSSNLQQTPHRHQAWGSHDAMFHMSLPKEPGHHKKA